MFQSTVNLQPAPGVAGDFASANPRATVVAGPGGVVAGVPGVTVGKFAWLNAAGTIATNHGTAPVAPAGFIHREQQALITAFLADHADLIPTGLPVTLHRSGDFWALNEGAATSAIGDAIYATYANGAITTGAAAPGATATGSMGSTNTASLGATFTASANAGDATQLDVTTVTGLISVGDKVSGTGITAGTTILSQVSGTAGGAGTYQLSASNTASAATVTAFGSTINVTSTTGLISVGDVVSGGAGFPVGATIASIVSGTGGAGVYTMSAPGTAYTASASGVTTFGNVVDVTAVASGVLAVGDPISGTGVPSGAIITSQLTGTAGLVGTYTLDLPATAYAASTTLTAVAGVLTAWKAGSIAAPGELVKISL